MKLITIVKPTAAVLLFLAAIMFNVGLAIAQSPTLRANGKIAFTSDRDGNREIYVMNADGTNQTRITNNSVNDVQPSWSPDGRKIAFISQRQTGEYSIFQMNADGTGKTEITPVNYQPSSSFITTGWKISWSPDSSRLVFRDVEANDNLIFIVNADGSNRRFLINGRNPTWSPDGSKILLITRLGSSDWLQTIKPDGTDIRTLPALPDLYNWYYDATWSPTGSEIARTATDLANNVIFISNADGTNPRDFHWQCGLLSPSGCSTVIAPSWSPDGRTIAFYYWHGPSLAEIYVKDIAGGEPRRLTNTNTRNVDPSWQPVSDAKADFDGDGRSDISVFRPSDRTWYLNQSTNGFSATQFGLSTDKITPADYDGDGRTDISVYREGIWFWLKSSDQTVGIVQFGLHDDIPVSADYTGDGRSELAVYRNGFWWSLNLVNDQASVVQFGTSTDKPVAADYDGDGRVDQAVYRDGEWHLNRSSLGYSVVNFGLATDKLVPADYDGDGRTDQAIYRDGTWYLLRSTNGFTAFQFGLATDIPVPADYDGDGKTDIAIYRNGTWYIVQSSTGTASYQQYGLSGDIPVAGANQ